MIKDLYFISCLQPDLAKTSQGWSPLWLHYYIITYWQDEWTFQYIKCTLKSLFYLNSFNKTYLCEYILSCTCSFQPELKTLAYVGDFSRNKCVLKRREERENNVSLKRSIKCGWNIIGIIDIFNGIKHQINMKQYHGNASSMGR